MIIVLDLDDTLYNEISFVESGFKTVSSYLQEKFFICPNESFNFMKFKLLSGRGRIFDDLLIKYDIYTKNEVKRCLSIYRLHDPRISLYEESEKFLTRFSKLPIYIVTDGNKIVQNNKINALGLQDRVKYSYITHRFGINKAKPSPYCFFKICERENALPGKIVYIGDNPNKDFVGIKPLGFKTVRVMTGQYRNVEKSIKFEAEFRLSSLADFDLDFLNNLFS